MLWVQASQWLGKYILRQFRQQVKALCDMHGYRFGLGIAEAGQF